MCSGGLVDYSCFSCVWAATLFFFVLISWSGVSGSGKTLSDMKNFTEISNRCRIQLEFHVGEDQIFHSLAQVEESFLVLPESLDLVLTSVAEPSQSFLLYLTRNRALLPIQDLQNNGSNLKESELCYYHGVASHDDLSHAAVNLCKGNINGVILLHGERFILESIDNETGSKFQGIRLIPSSHYVDDAWVGEEEASQSFEDTALSQTCNFFSASQSLVKNLRFKRGTKRRPTPGYYNNYLDGQTRYVELVIVNDNSLYRKFNFDKQLVEDRARQIANIVNSLYFPLNIRISLVGMETWAQGDRVTITDDGDYTLQNFLLYRKKRLNVNHPNDNAQLITDRILKSGVVGKALKGTMCSFERSGGVNLDHSRRIVSVASTMAHEMGHNFGMEHDNDTCECPNDQRCIMSASSGGLAPTYWSSCSLEYLEWGLKHGSDFCLKNVPGTGRIVAGPVCGNGIVEAGEQCDCGVPGTCDNDCCNATNCQLTIGAECASGGCCDTKKCKVKSATSTCRAQSDECDLAEYCDGKTELCPMDVHKQNGISCNSGEGYCHSGVCGVRTKQCQLLWGSTGHSSPDVCYSTLNTHSNVHGNCGFNRADEKYVPCQHEDVLCGRLHCVHQNERTEYGDRSVVQTAHTFLQMGGGNYAVCRVAQLDLGGLKDNDPGMVPSGTKCGNRKMCSDAKCTPVDKILKERPCDPPDCNGVGVCNSRGNCHCNFGYGGGDCAISGLGGSLDSGPSGPAGGFNVWIGVAVFVFLVFPLMIAALTFLYRKKKHWLVKYKVLRYLLPRNEAKTLTPRSDGSAISSNSSSPSHRLVFAAKPPPIKGIPITEAQELFKQQRSQKSLTELDIGFPPLPPSAASKPTHLLEMPIGASATLPRPLKNTAINPPKLSENFVAQLDSPAMTSSVVDYSSSGMSTSSTLGRSASQRPKKPAPPRPKRPRDSVMDQLYAENGGQLKDSEESSGLLTEVLSALEGKEDKQAPDFVPHRRAPQPPVDPEQPNKPKPILRPPKQATPPPEDPASEEQWATIDESVNTEKPSISGPSNPVIGGKIMTKSPELTVVPSLLPGNTQTLPTRRVQRTVSSAGESSDGRIEAGRKVQRSVSSASTSSGKSVRPSKAPPPPPKPAPLVESDDIEDENYYDVIPTPPEEKPVSVGFAGLKKPVLPLPSSKAMSNDDSDKTDKKKSPPSLKKPPLPSKPKNAGELLKLGSSSELKAGDSNSKVSALKAKFDQKSGNVKTSVVK